MTLHGLITGRGYRTDKAEVRVGVSLLRTPNLMFYLDWTQAWLDPVTHATRAGWG